MTGDHQRQDGKAAPDHQMSDRTISDVSVAGGDLAGDAAPSRPADLSVWLIWAAVMLVAIAVLPFAARSQDVVRAIANMCGFSLE